MLLSKIEEQLESNPDAKILSSSTKAQFWMNSKIRIFLRLQSRLPI